MNLNDFLAIKKHNCLSLWLTTVFDGHLSLKSKALRSFCLRFVSDNDHIILMQSKQTSKIGKIKFQDLIEQFLNLCSLKVSFFRLNQPVRSCVEASNSAKILKLTKLFCFFSILRYQITVFLFFCNQLTNDITLI